MKLLDPNNPRKNIILVHFLFGTVATICYVWIFFVSIANIMDAYRSKNWLPAPGKVILSADSEQVYTPGSGCSIWYEFRIGDHLYRSDRVNFFERAAIENYKQDQEVTVYYDPIDPSSACLVRGVSLWGSLNVFFLGVGLLTSGASLIHLFRGWLKK